MNMDMYVYRVTEKQDSEIPGKPGEAFEAFERSVSQHGDRRLRGACSFWRT